MTVWIFSLFLLFYFLRAPSMAAASALEALRLCASGLIPSLYPFLVLIGVMNGSGMTYALSSWLGKPLGALFGMPESASHAILLGAIGGFPIGTVCTRELYDHGVLSREEAERLCAFTNNASPAYCISGIGATMFHDVSLGVRLYFCQLIAALLLGLWHRGRRPIGKRQSFSVKRRSLSEIFTAAVTQGGMTMLRICSFTVFFAIIGDLACRFAAFFWGEIGAALVASLCELTLAARHAAALSGISAELFAAFAVGYSGLSVYMQIASILSGSGIRLAKYRRYKWIQGVLSASLMALSHFLCS